MEDIEKLAEIKAPYGKSVSFTKVTYDNGFQILRMRIREGKRFTDMDLDFQTALQWQAIFSDWLDKHAGQ